MYISIPYNYVQHGREYCGLCICASTLYFSSYLWRTFLCHEEQVVHGKNYKKPHRQREV